MCESKSLPRPKISNSNNIFFIKKNKLKITFLPVRKFMICSPFPYKQIVKSGFEVFIEMRNTM